MLRILYKRYYREVYILYLLCFILFEYLLRDLWVTGRPLFVIPFLVTVLFGVFTIIIPCEFPKSYRNSYGNKECKNKCIVISGHFYTWESKCEHCKYCPHSIHKYQHKVFKHMRIFKNKFLGY